MTSGFPTITSEDRRQWIKPSKFLGKIISKLEFDTQTIKYDGEIQFVRC
jgi:hypothetical protein